MDASVLKMIVHMADPSLDAEDQERDVQRLFNQLRDVDEIESVHRPIDPFPPEGNKAAGGFVAGTLVTEIRPLKLGTVLTFLGDRLARKPVELELEAHGLKMRFKANSQDEIIQLLPAVQQLINGPTAIPVPGLKTVPSTSSRPSSQAAPLSVFFSYAHKDEALRNELAIHLTMLNRQGVISSWYDREVSAGTDWAGAIDQHLKQAHLILLLVSANFLASDYCYDIELKQAMERHRAGTARVIPIILRPSDWTSAPFGHLQVLPKDAKPITTWDNQDEAFLNVVQAIRATIQQMTEAIALP